MIPFRVLWPNVDCSRKANQNVLQCSDVTTVERNPITYKTDQRQAQRFANAIRRYWTCSKAIHIEPCHYDPHVQEDDKSLTAVAQLEFGQIYP